MNKSELFVAVTNVKEETKNVLQLVYDALNSGQKKKIIKDEQVKALFDLYGVVYE